MRQLAALFLVLSLTGVCVGAKKPKEQVVVSFSGAVKRITKKAVVIETEGDNEMTFVRTRQTKFLSGGKPIDGGAIPQGVHITVQAFERLNLELEAVSVTVAVADQSPNK